MGLLDQPTPKVRAALEAAFRPLAAIGDGFIAQRRACLAAATRSRV